MKSLGTKDVSEARLLFARVAAEIEERFATLRAGITTLSERDASVMAGKIYRQKVTGNINDLGNLSEPWVDVQQWRDGKMARKTQRQRAELTTTEMHKFRPLSLSAAGEFREPRSQ